MLASVLLAFSLREIRREVGQPFLTAGEQVVSGQRVSQFLQAGGITTSQKGVGTLLKGDVLSLHPLGKPMMLIQTHASGKRKVRAYPHEHAAPMAVLNVEVILDDPALGHLEEPTIILLISVGYQNPCGFRARSTATTVSSLAPLKYGSMKSSRRPAGASNTGTSHFCERLVTQFLY